MQVAEPKELLQCLQYLIRIDQKPMRKVLPLFTENPARRLKLHNKGKVHPSLLEILVVLIEVAATKTALNQKFMRG